MRIQLPDPVAGDVRNVAEALFAGTQLQRPFGNPGFELFLVHAQFHQQLCQISQQQAEQQSQHHLQAQAVGIAPARDRRGTERPAAVGQVHGLVYRVGKRGGTRCGDGLAFSAVRMGTPEFVGKALFRHLREQGAVEYFGKADQHRSEAPELTLVAAKINRQPSDRCKAALNQRERPGQGKFSAVAGKEGFLVAYRIQQQVVADGLFVAGQRNDVPHDPAGCQLQRGRAGIEAQQLLCRGFEVGDPAAPLAHQRGQRIGGGQCVLDAALNRHGMVVHHVGDPGSLLLQPQLF